ncbi:MAG: stage II sporulation protein E [Bacillota bacterium]
MAGHTGSRRSGKFGESYEQRCSRKVYLSGRQAHKSGAVRVTIRRRERPERQEADVRRVGTTSRAMPRWTNLASPESVVSGLIGFLLGRAVILGAASPFGISYLAVIASSRVAAIPLTAAGVLLGMTGPVLNLRTVWPAVPVVLVTLAGRALSSRRATSKPFVLPASVLLFGFVVPTALKMSMHLPIPALPIVMLEAVIGALAAAVLDWSGICRRFVTSPADGGTISLEKVASLGLLCAGVIMGLAGIGFHGISAGAVLAGLATVITAYLGGGALGAVAGALTGLACAMSGQGLIPVAGAYALGGLVAGISRNHGKLAATAGFFAGAGLLVFQVASGGDVPVFMGQLAASGVVFLSVPRSYLYKMGRLIPSSHARSVNGNVHARRVQDLLSRKLYDFAKVFDELSSMLRQVPYDPELAERADIAHILHKVASSSCSRCRSYLFCWGDAFHRTFRDVLNLVALAELRGTVDASKINGQLRRRCIDVPGLVAAVNGTTGSYRQNLTYAKRLVEGRQMLSNQLQGAATLLKGLGMDVWARVEFETCSEEKIMRELSRLGLGVTDVSVAVRGRGRLDVTVKKGACCGDEECKKAVAPLVSRLIGRSLDASKARCGYRGGSPACDILLSPSRTYSVATSVSVFARDGQAVSGDTHSVLELADGRLVFVLSDGMGAGQAAAIESSTAVSMLERLLEAGFDDEFAVKTVNLILLLRSPGETFATLDVVTVDLVTGDGQFIKVGSSPSFIKTGRDVRVIRSVSLPAGVFDAIEVEKTPFRFSDGDLLVMVSDGVLNSVEPSPGNEEWVVSAISRMSTDEPGEVARFILDRARQQAKGKVSDDMTVLVGRVYRRQPVRRIVKEPLYHNARGFTSKGA